MKRLWQFLLHGCFHEYEIYQTTLVMPNNGDQTPDAQLITQRCKKCGHMHNFKISS